jgi:hypothetical protein
MLSAMAYRLGRTVQEQMVNKSHRTFHRTTHVTLRIDIKKLLTDVFSLAVSFAAALHAVETALCAAGR